MNLNLQKIKQIIQDSQNIVFFGGAGTSTESGIPDFRSATGLFNTKAGGSYTPEEVLSHDFFMNEPNEFYRFYFKHMIYPEAKPNKAHVALAELEQMGKLRAVITQNIDGLHQLAGSRNVLELHGSVMRNYCMECRAYFELNDILSINEGEIPQCNKCSGLIKPDVVLYQEALNHDVMQRAKRAIADAEVLIVAGTSLKVYPAAGLIQFYSGDRMILVNKSTTPQDRLANFVIQDSIGEVLESIT